MRNPADNETFVYLVMAAREDRNLRDQLQAVLRMDDFNRESLLRTWADRIQLEGGQGAGDFAEALLALVDPEAARLVLQLLTSP